MPRNKFTLLAIVLLTGSQAFSQTETQHDKLRKAGEIQAAKERTIQAKLQQLAKKKNWPLSYNTKNGGIAVLTRTNWFGNPVYLATESNQVAAATIGTSKLWEGGALGLNLSGSSNAVKNKMAVWDGGRVRETHVELNGRIVISDKNKAALSDHATHVAGTMVATGVNPVAKGMAYKMQSMTSYYFENHISEMYDAAANLLVSNHSYGEIAGWYYSGTRWEFRAPYNFKEDPAFGQYTEETQAWDSMAYNAPYYLIVKSSGNNRDENGPDLGDEYYRYNSSNQMVKAIGGRPDSLSRNDSYDIISSYGTAKNILTVGAVNPVPAGYSAASDVVMSSFSSWGPTDDGRIKPDVVGDGVGLTSSIATSNNAYATYSGTSMATPNVTGSLLLLQEYYAQLHSNTFMRSATLKGLTIHTADEAGPNPGPDYQFGWGLVNVAKAALLIKDDNSPAKKQIIQENTLNNGNTYTLSVIASGTGPLVATICWTDPKGAITDPDLLNDPTPKLVHDLDLRITEGSNTFMPWILDPTNNTTRAKAATKGDNKLDNVEKIEIPNAIPGKTYVIKVMHKGTLARGSQAFSLIVSGVGGTAACATSAPADANGARINAITLNDLSFTAANTTTCTQYIDNTTSVASIESNTQYNASVTVGTCSGSLATHAFKFFADLNNNGTFDLPSELLYTSTAISPGTNTNKVDFTIQLPAGLTVGQSIRARIVLVETNTPANIAPCGSYTRGETHDFLMKVTKPSNDVGITEIISPYNDDCASGPQNVAVRIRNAGKTNQSNVPVAFKIMNGATTVLDVNENFPGTVKPESDVVYTLQKTFTPVAGATYQVEAQSNLSNDQNAGNNKLTASVSISPAAAAPSGTIAQVCNNTRTNLRATASANDVFFWYDAQAATNPIATGASTSTTIIPASKKYYIDKNNSTIHIGPATNGTLNTTGSYKPNILYWTTFTNTAPVLIESVRLYISRLNTSGKVLVLVASGNGLLVDANGRINVNNIESSTEIDIYRTHPTEGATTYSANDKGAIFQLNLPVTSTGTHGIMIYQQPGDDQALFFGNNNLTTNPYPNGINGVFTLTGNINSQLSTNDPQKYYYVFYDMKVRYINCPSARVEVAATDAIPPTATLNGNVLTSSSATGNQWWKDDNIIPGAINQTYTAAAPGTYKVVVTNSYGCSLTSNTVPYAVTAIPNVDPAAIGLKVLPNPSDGRFVTDFSVTRKADLNIAILNTLGQKVHEQNYPGFVGRFNKTIEAAHLTSGVYMLRIQHDNKSYLTKIVIR